MEKYLEEFDVVLGVKLWRRRGRYLVSYMKGNISNF